MNYEFDWSLLLQEPNWSWVVEGVSNTVQLSLLAWVLALTLGVLIGAIRMSRFPFLRLIGTTYVEIFRNIPLLIQLFLWFFVFPLLLPEDIMRAWNRLDGVPFLTALIGLSLFTAARIANPKGTISCGVLDWINRISNLPSRNHTLCVQGDDPGNSIRIFNHF